jgi:hypothetical protein
MIDGECGYLIVRKVIKRLLKKMENVLKQEILKRKKFEQNQFRFNRYILFLKFGRNLNEETKKKKEFLISNSQRDENKELINIKFGFTPGKDTPDMISRELVAEKYIDGTDLVSS